MGARKCSVKEVLPALEAMQERRRRRCLVEARAAARAGGVARPVAGAELEMRVHPHSFHHWGQRLGYGCWDDKGFRREYRRDVPESRVRTMGSRPSSSLASVPGDRLRALFGANGRMRRGCMEMAGA
jgi:hypothetical protein